MLFAMFPKSNEKTKHIIEGFIFSLYAEDMMKLFNTMHSGYSQESLQEHAHFSYREDFHLGEEGITPVR